MNHPSFSVIIPTQNRAESLKMAVKSVLSQNFHDFEVIVIDDASTDHTADVVQSFEDGRIHYSRNETNRHKGATRNRGIRMATGRYICFLDDDDYYLPSHLANFCRSIEDKGFPEGIFYAGL